MCITRTRALKIVKKLKFNRYKVNLDYQDLGGRNKEMEKSENITDLGIFEYVEDVYSTLILTVSGTAAIAELA